MLIENTGALPSTFGPLLVTLDLARRIEAAEITFCASAALPTTPHAGRLDAGGGTAVRAAHGSPMNKVLGLGIGGPVADEDLDAIEAFYAEHGLVFQIEVCPLATPDLPRLLARRGYAVDSFETELAMPLDGRPWPRVEGVEIDEAGRADDELWLDVVARGFAAGDDDTGAAATEEAVTAIRGIMVSLKQPSSTRYLARVGGAPAGGGEGWLNEGVLGVFGTATLPAFRRRGVQTALIFAALDGPRGAADLAIATTAPGSQSQRTFQRVGFQVVYTRAIYSKRT